MTLMVIAKVARMEKQIASAMPACIPTLKPSCGLMPGKHQYKTLLATCWRKISS